MSVFKKIWADSFSYGSVTILARLLNYAMVYFHVRWLQSDDYGVMSTFYSGMALLNVMYILGLETAFFRFIHILGDDKKKIGTLQSLVLGWALMLSVLLFLFADGIALQLGNPNYATFLRYCSAILFFDALCSLPFVQLRFERKTKKYVSLKVLSILINIVLQFVLVYVLSIEKVLGLEKVHAIFLANLGASVFVFMLLVKHIQLCFRWDKEFIKTVLIYSLPLVLSGLAGMMNETIDRIMLPFLASPDLAEGQQQNGIYAANYKLSMMVTLFVQAYRLGAEPFLFKMFKEEERPQQHYAHLMHIFIILTCVVCLFVVLFLHLWKSMIVSDKHPEYEEGIFVVPILALANLMLGIYFNLSIWFKVINKTLIGLVVMMLAGFLTLSLNYGLIPIYGYWACAWITLAVYGFMVILTYVLGRKYYPIPYKISGAFYYLFSTTLVILIYHFFIYPHFQPLTKTFFSIVLMLLFCFFIFWKDRTLVQKVKSHFSKNQ